jgi:hypothetical protein
LAADALTKATINTKPLIVHLAFIILVPFLIGTTSGCKDYQMMQLAAMSSHVTLHVRHSVVVEGKPDIKTEPK